ncbi:hypothetical protein [Actinomadura terrae]|uniref:hypothetical protein n=1 Tax=Actinomadura terrae TaxID=604353 RepID=UPI001FA6C5E1|nr:hypothetical protein [Actinomadura terrae]
MRLPGGKVDTSDRVALGERARITEEFTGSRPRASDPETCGRSAAVTCEFKPVRPVRLPGGKVDTSDRVALGETRASDALSSGVIDRAREREICGCIALATCKLTMLRLLFTSGCKLRSIDAASLLSEEDSGP